MEYIYEEVASEIERANKKWGTDFDEQNTLNDWLVYAMIYLGKAGQVDKTEDEQRKALIKAAGLVINAINWLDSGDMPKRHYD